MGCSTAHPRLPAADPGSPVPRSFDVDDDGTATVATTQDLSHDVLPRLVAAVYPGDLKLVSSETWRPTSDGPVRGDIRIKAVGVPGSYQVRSRSLRA